MQPATSPTLLQSVVPQKSYKDLAEQLGRIKADTDVALEERYLQAGTPAETGARQAGIQAQEAASYLASIPQEDFFSRADRGFMAPDRFAPAREAARDRLTEAQLSYAKALENITQKPKKTPFKTPSWAEGTIPEAG
jgi:hypothetical protein